MSDPDPRSFPEMAEQRAKTLRWLADELDKSPRKRDPLVRGLQDPAKMASLLRDNAGVLGALGARVSYLEEFAETLDERTYAQQVIGSLAGCPPPESSRAHD